MNLLYYSSEDQKFKMGLAGLSRRCWQSNIPFGCSRKEFVQFLKTAQFLLCITTSLRLCFFFFLFLLLLYWGYIVTFTKVLITYHSWIHPLHHSPLSPPPPHSWNSFNRSHFSIYRHEYIILSPYSPSCTILPHLPPPISNNPPDRTCFAFLFCVFVKKKKKKRERFLIV
jgi:hypothetical protein